MAVVPVALWQLFAVPAIDRMETVGRVDTTASVCFEAVQILEARRGVYYRRVTGSVFSARSRWLRHRRPSDGVIFTPCIPTPSRRHAPRRGLSLAITNSQDLVGM